MLTKMTNHYECCNHYFTRESDCISDANCASCGQPVEPTHSDMQTAAAA